MGRSDYDAVVIGGGHNGLAAAAYLAKAGKRVCVLERREILGGASCTQEVWPGYRVSTAAYVISLFSKQIMADLRLPQYGLTILPRNPSSFTPTRDDRYLLLGPDERRNREEIGKFSSRDAEAYPRYSQLLEQIAATIEPLLEEPAPDVLPLPKSWRRIGLKKRFGDLRRAWRLYSGLRKLGSKIPEAAELILGAARPLLERWFESEPLRATLATDAIIGAFTSISAPGSSYVLLHHVMGEAGGARGVWGYVQGGMGGVANALERACRDLGVEIRREAPVEEILASGGRAVGVRVGDDELRAKVVASSVDPHLTFRRLLPEGVLGEEFGAAIDRIDYSSASAKVNLALGEPPNFTAAPSRGVAEQHHGTMHVGPDIDYLERAYDDAKYGRPSERPILEMTLPTSVDHTIAPEGKHILTMFVQYAPYRLAEGTWDDAKEAFGRRCVDALAEFAPNVPGAIEGMHILTPLDLEREFGLTGGNIFQGAMSPWQLHLLRPVPGWADHRTPVPGLYLCGAASHPGGGVMGVCGRNAAAAMLDDGV